MIDTLQGAFLMANPHSGQILASNQLAGLLLGLSQTELIGQSLPSFLHDPDFTNLISTCCKSDLVYCQTGIIRSSMGRQLPVQYSARVITWEHPVLVLTFNDNSLQLLVSRLSRLQAPLLDLMQQTIAEHSGTVQHDHEDYLTGIIPHHKFLENFNTEIGHAKRHKNTLAFLQLMPEIKAPAHEKKDEPAIQREQLFKQVAGMLCVHGSRDADIVGRSETGNLLMMLRQTNVAGAYKLAKRIQKRLASFTPVTDSPLTAISCCIGITSLSKTDKSGKDVMTRLQTALNRARLQGENSIITLI